MHILGTPIFYRTGDFTPKEAQARATAWLLTGSSIDDWIPFSTKEWEVRWEQQIREAAKRIQDPNT